MNEKVIIIGIAATALATSLLVGVSSTQASAATPQEVKQVLDNYMAAVKAGNAEEVAKYVHDYRFKDQAETVAGYKQAFANDQITDIKLVDLKSQNEKLAKLTLEVTTQNTGTNQFEYPVEKEGENWKVILKDVKKVKNLFFWIGCYERVSV